MAVAWVQSIGKQESGTVASCSVTFASASTAGNLIAMSGVIYAASTYTVTDGVNTYEQDVQKVVSNETVFQWHTFATTGATLTVVITNTGGNKYTSIAVGEFSGVSGIRARFNSAANGSGTTPVAGSITSVTAGSLYLAAIGHDNGTVSITPDGGFTEIFENESASNEPISMIYQIQGTAGALNPGWTFGSAVGSGANDTMYEPVDTRLVANLRYQSGGANGGTTPAINTTGASLLVVTISTYLTTPGVADLSDSKGNTWTALTSKATGQVGACMFYCKNPTVGSGHTFTYAVTGTYPGMEVLAFSGMDTSAPFDVENGGVVAGAGGTTVQPGSITPSTNGQVIVCGFATRDACTTLSINSSFIGPDWLDYVTDVGIGASYLVQATAAAINPTYTVTTNSGGIIALIASFKSSAGGGTVVPALDGEMLVGGFLEMSGGL